MLGQALNIHAERAVFTNSQTTLRTFIRVSHQVLNLLIIDFNLGKIDFKFHVFALLSLDSFENFIAGHWNDAGICSVANHGITFACPCLAISKETAIIAVPGIVQNLLA